MKKRALVPVTPVTQAKKLELEDQLKQEKRRLQEASSRVLLVLRHDLSPRRWMETYPLASAAVIFAGGYLLGRNLPLGPRPRKVEEVPEDFE